MMKINFCIKKILSKNSSGQSKGQILIEYVFLLALSTVLAALLIKLVSVEPSENTVVFRYWKHLLEMIGEDIST